MARPDKQARQEARAREMVKSALTRRRMGEAADALLKLPSKEREFALSHVALGMQQELDGAVERRDAAAVLSWLPRVEREPRLLDTLAPRALWALLVAAMRVAQWPQAQLLFQRLPAERLPADVFSALQSVLATRGEVPSGLVELVTRLDAEAARLGHELPRARPQVQAPRSAQEIEEQVLYCFASEPWAKFCETTASWRSGAPKDMAIKMAALCAELSKPELLERSRRGDSSTLAVAQSTAELVAAAGSPAELEDLASLSLRAAVGALRNTRPSAKQMDTLLALVGAVQRYESLRPLLAPAIFGAGLGHASTRTRSELLKLAVSVDGSPRVLVAAVLTWHLAESKGEHDAASTPPWLVSAVERALDAPEVLAKAVMHVSSVVEQQAGEVSACQEPFHALVMSLSNKTAARAIETLWPHVEDPHRAQLAHLAADVMDQMEVGQSSGSDVDRLIKALKSTDPDMELPPKGELRALLRSAMGQSLLNIMPGKSKTRAPEVQKAFWSLARLAAPYDMFAMEQVFTLDPEGAEAWQLFRQFNAHLPTLVARMRAMKEAAMKECLAVAQALEEHLCNGIVPKATDAARVVLMLVKLPASPMYIRQQVAQALQQAVDREPDALTDAEVVRALKAAKKFVGAKKKAAKKKAAKKKAAKKKATKKKTARQADTEPAKKPAARAAKPKTDVQLSLDSIVKGASRAES